MSLAHSSINSEEEMMQYAATQIGINGGEV